MTDLTHKLKTLAEISGLLEPTKKQRKAGIDALAQFTDDFIGRLPGRNSFSHSHPDTSKLAISGAMTGLDDLLAIYEQEVVNHGIIAASGGHIGYIPGGGIFYAALGDFLADISNEFAGMYFASPGGVTIENELIRWLKTIFGFPETAVGNLTSGGSIANLVAVAAARDKHKIKGEKIAKSVVYIGPQTHHCIHKAIRLTGLEDVVIREIELDEFHRIKPAHLEELIRTDRKNGLLPFMVIASAGTTDTGAVDPLNKLADIAEANKMWYHIDAAYGGFFVLTETAKKQFNGIERADSLVVDPHKGLFLPYGLGAVLVRDRDALLQSNHYTANYMQDALNPDMPLNPADVSPELTKHFRGLRLWIPLRMLGIEPFVACLEEKLLLVQYFRQKLQENSFQLGPEPDLSVSYFWYEPKVADQNEFNKALMRNIHLDGRIFLSSTRIGGMDVIRIAILSFRTKMETVDVCVEMILRCLEKTKTEFGE